jgi:hypothetical protein
MEELNSYKAGWYGASPLVDAKDAKDGTAANLAIRGLARSGLVYPVICKLNDTAVERLRANKVKRVGRRRMRSEQRDT